MGTQERLKDNKRPIFEAIFQVTRVVVTYGRGQKQLKKNYSTSKEYLGQTTYLLKNVT